MRSDYIPTHPSGPEYNAMEKVRTQITHAPVHGVGAGFFVPNGSVPGGLGTHVKGILSPMVSSKYPSWHWKVQNVLSTSAVFGPLTAWIRTSLIDCSSVSSVDSAFFLQSPASILRLLIVTSSTVHVCATEHGQKIVK